MASMSENDQASMELAQQFTHGDLHHKLITMRTALNNTSIDIHYICAAVGIHPEPVCIMHWLGEHDPAILAFRAQHFPNAPGRIEGIYV
jgi:hypothetical protein